MNQVKALDEWDWATLDQQLDTQGLALLPGLLPRAMCHRLVALDNDSTNLEGLEGMAGIEPLRHALYARLQPTANRWTQALGLAQTFPPSLPAFLATCRQAGQGLHPPRSALHRLAAGSHLPCNPPAGGGLAFPLQMCILLSEPGVDFTGGELVLTEQRPRMQTRALVPPLRQGGAAIFATHHRPHRGSQGFYRTMLRQAVSVVRSGTRVVLNLVFHEGTVETAEQR